MRLKDLKRLFHHRYGIYLPDDDAGREDLEELLLVGVNKFLPLLLLSGLPGCQ